MTKKDENDNWEQQLLARKMKKNIPKFGDIIPKDKISYDGLNIIRTGTEGLTGKYKKARMELNLKALVEFLEQNYNEPFPLVVIPSYMIRDHPEWMSPWINPIITEKQEDDDYWMLATMIANGGCLVSNDKYKNWKISEDTRKQNIIKFNIVGSTFDIKIPKSILTKYKSH